MPSRDFTSEDLFSSRMMSMQSSTHSSQMNTDGPAISLRTSCWLFPQKEQYKSLSLEDLSAIQVPAPDPAATAGVGVHSCPIGCLTSTLRAGRPLLQDFVHDAVVA